MRENTRVEVERHRSAEDNRRAAQTSKEEVEQVKRNEAERRRSAEDRARTAEERLEDERRAAQTSKEEAEQAKRNEAEEKKETLEVGGRASRDEGVTQGTRGYLSGSFTCPPMQLVLSSLSFSVDLYVPAPKVTPFAGVSLDLCHYFNVKSPGPWETPSGVPWFLKKCNRDRVGSGISCMLSAVFAARA